MNLRLGLYNVVLHLLVLVLVWSARRHARARPATVATLLPLASGATLAPGELSVELTPKGGQWVLVTDAWFFAEGQAERWAAARYGEFRVDSQGRALLVGLRDAERRPL